MYGAIPIDLVPLGWHDCHNSGPCCYSCPHFDECDNHNSEEE